LVAHHEVAANQIGTVSVGGDLGRLVICHSPRRYPVEAGFTQEESRP
jgi:hypothetical protein